VLASFSILLKDDLMLPAAQRYAAFLDTVTGGVAEPALPGWREPLSELDLQSLWFAGEFGSEFTTTCGRRIAIRDFGVWNHAAGPDFTGCAVQHESGVWRGDIELDPHARDWERHGHGANAAYENVVLHLFTQGPEARMFTRTARHREVTQVQLTPDLLGDAARPGRLPEARLGRCALPLREMGEAQVEGLLEAAAQYRMQRKGERLHALIRIHGREQAIFQSLAGALGYRNNQRVFTVLAQRLPLRGLLKMDALEREALLFGVSGFLEAVQYEQTEGETRAYLRGLWSEWWKQRHAYLHWIGPDQLLRWQMSGSRPGNHPQRRLGALSAMLRGWKQVAAPLAGAGAWSAREFSDRLLSLEHEYWTRHFTSLAEPAAKPVALVGGTRVQEILANVCYPLMIPEKGALWEEFTRLPAKLDNQKVRRASLRLFGDDPRASHFQKRLYQQQGLLQVYEDYCLADDSACAQCPFPERLKEWSGGAETPSAKLQTPSSEMGASRSEAGGGRLDDE